MESWWLKWGVRLAGHLMIPTVPFKEAYFLEDALQFRQHIKDVPLVYVGGLVSRKKIDEVLEFRFRVCTNGTGTPERTRLRTGWKEEEQARCNCKHSNYCIARMYTLDMACHQHLEETLPPHLKKEIEKLEKEG